MDFFDELLKEKPKGKRGENTVAAFVRSHFGRLRLVRAEGYTWKQIARVVKGKTNITSSSLHTSLRVTFSIIKKERTAKSFLKSLEANSNVS